MRYGVRLVFIRETPAAAVPLFHESETEGTLLCDSLFAHIFKEDHP